MRARLEKTFFTKDQLIQYNKTLKIDEERSKIIRNINIQLNSLNILLLLLAAAIYPSTQEYTMDQRHNNVELKGFHWSPKHLYTRYLSWWSEMHSI